MKNLMLLTMWTLFLFTSTAQGQETKAKQFENPQWFEIVQVKYKAGQKEKAQAIIKDHFMATGMESNLPGPHMMLDLVSGEWDMIFIWELEEGIKTLDFEISPTGAKFRDAFMKKVGGEEKAREIWQEYYSYIQDWKTELARKWE
ncbi:MAG: hypothetical protein R3209_12265 [Salinimicrobium sediminis]|nr:hypothetical protein [Salinimicrobium sediminis]